MTRTMKKWFQAIGLAAALAFVAAAPVGAVDINNGLTPGALNTIEDQDREAYIDADNSGTLSLGDVFIGFVRLDNFLPSGADPGDTVYGVISNQIVAVNVGGDPTIFSLGTTTVAGLTLQDLTGDANTTGGMFAIYDGIVAEDLITNTIGAADIFDYIDYITTGDLRLVTGIVSPDNYVMVDNGPAFPVGTPNFTFPLLTASVTTGSFSGGLDILYNDTNFAYLDAVLTFDALGIPHVTQVGIGNGSVRGAFEDGHEGQFGFAPGYTQCSNTPSGPGTASVPCGFVTDADFFVRPVRIPEPGSLALLGVALLAGVAVRRGLKKA